MGGHRRERMPLGAGAARTSPDRTLPAGALFGVRPWYFAPCAFPSSSARWYADTTAFLAAHTSMQLHKFLLSRSTNTTCVQNLHVSRVWLCLYILLCVCFSPTVIFF